MELSYLGTEVDVTVTEKYGLFDRKTCGKRKINIGMCNIEDNKTPVTAYVYGVKYPLKKYRGIITGIGVRSDGSNFLIITQKGVTAYDVNVCPLIDPYEKPYMKLTMAHEKSCGALIYRYIDGEIRFLLVNQRLSHSWSFPKGHIMYGESEQKTAAREVFEEVGMKIRFVSGFRIEQFYRIKPSTVKKVVIFLAKSDDEIKIDNDEIVNYVWASEESIPKYLHKHDAMTVVRRAKEHLRRERVKINK